MSLADEEGLNEECASQVNTNWPDVAYPNWREGSEMMKTAIETIVGAVLVQSRILNWIFRGRSLGHDSYSSHSIGRMIFLCMSPCGLLLTKASNRLKCFELYSSRIKVSQFHVASNRSKPTARIIKL